MAFLRYDGFRRNRGQVRVPVQQETWGYSQHRRADPPSGFGYGCVRDSRTRAARRA